MSRRTLLCTLGCLLALPVSGHRPAVLDDVVVVERPEVSHALYGTLNAERPLMKVSMVFDAPFAMPFELLVPHQPGYEDFRPFMAVVAPGLPPPTEQEAAALEGAGIEIPEGAGAYVDFNDDEERLVIFESFTRRVFWSTGPIALAVGSGETQIFVHSPDGAVGDVVVGFGVEEDFSEGFGEVFANWTRYAY